MQDNISFIFDIAINLWLIEFFLSKGISAKVISNPFGINIGSYPKPSNPLGLSIIFPSTFPSATI